MVKMLNIINNQKRVYLTVINKEVEQAKKDHESLLTSLDVFKPIVKRNMSIDEVK